MPLKSGNRLVLMNNTKVCSSKPQLMWERLTTFA